MAGMWSKLLLVTASFGSGEWMMAAAMIVSSLLSLCLPPARGVPRAVSADGARAVRDFVAAGRNAGRGGGGDCHDGGGCLVLFVLADAVANYLEPLRTESFVEGAP